MKTQDKIETFINIVNSNGYVVKEMLPHEKNKFGKTDLVTIENGEHRITFETNVLHGANYFKIIKLDRYLQGRTYKSPKYFIKYIPLINQINGKIYTSIY